MKRVWHLFILMAAIAIGSLLWSRVTPALVLPSAVDAWSLARPQHCAKPATADFQIWPGTSGARQVCRAEYAGSPEMTLTVYDMPGGPRATAFGPFQDWLTGPKPPGKLVFHYRDYLGIVESPNADVITLDRFAAAVEATLHR
jgi:hypothetical protein